ncbi:MAG: DUF937 domain-containing protein [Cyanomargarita calcarea GSE-NOS-MK-12-04C]|jgi:hypothetical protein|uniref:DUF937 domain-containing protein n=1 Tax=Cyanomargarita calcarea GSE-NOS-MK-12-04C TaxID=2839659 RepID=A0A951QQ84_9CYAN|nr:DUF937 domain-containing protein [Cyanomargarita calcarea GSE-NOS-MK-12-04C]
MGLFDQILGAAGNSNQEGGLGQLGNILNTVQQLSSNTGVDSGTMQTVLSVVGGQVRSALQQKRDTEGDDAVQNLVNDFAGTSPNPQAVDSLFGQGMQQQIAQMAAQRTGLDAGMLQQALPMIVPAVLNLLQSGGNTQGGGNPMISAFLDSDGDGDVDITDIMQMAAKYMGR